MKFRPYILVFFLFGLFQAGNAFAQDGSFVQLKNNIQRLRQNKAYLTDTTYFNAVLMLAFRYADSYPDSAISLLSGVPDQCRSAKFIVGEIGSYNAFGNAWQTKGNFDSAVYYYNRAYGLAEKTGSKAAVPDILGNIALVYLNRGNYNVALQKFYESMHAAEKQGNKLLVRNSLNNIGTINFYQGKMNEAETAYIKTLRISQELADTANIVLAYNNIGEVNVEQHDLKKAIANLSIGYELARKKNMPDMEVAVSNTLGDCYYRTDSLQTAETLFQSALSLAEKTENARGICKANIGLAKVNNRLAHYPAALNFGLQALARSQKMGQAQLQRDALEIVADIYQNMGDGRHAIIYYKEFKKFSDSLVNIENERVSSNLKADYEIAKKDEAYQRKAIEQRWWIFSALAGFLVAVLIGFIIYRNNKKLDHTYKELKVKSGIIEGQKIEAEKTLSKLKVAQRRLVQSEKLASLGELTAGIAHEIQNPLNFVNNFSEVSTELIDEMKDELAAGNTQHAIGLAGDIKYNLEKIAHHGKRADAIVKGMLQHSRNSGGHKELTDINALCDEYLRLAYHGLRAKDKSFNASFATEFDDTLGSINIIPQDIGRVILNLITNAFYAVDEKKKQAGENYKPTVIIKTAHTQTPDGKQAEIRVTDNGNGVPQNIIDKIFQPFFTTKPAGKGTGLGLSMSYDIVKGHNGEIKIDTEEGQGTSFIITLPIQ